MLTPMPFFYLTLASAGFLVTSMAIGHRGRLHHGARHGARAHGGAGRAGTRAIHFWSLNTVLLFLTGFGVGGFCAATAGLVAAPTLATATAAGLALAAIELSLLAALTRREGSSTIRADEFIGSVGTVEISIAAGGVGRIRCRRGNAAESLLAKSNGEAIAAGSLVRVASVVGSTVIVEPVGPDEDRGFLTWKDSQQ